MTEEAQELTTEFLLAAYANGYFPMAESRSSDKLYWFYPEERGIIPLDNFHIPHSLEKFMRKNPFTITCDKAFTDVMRGCTMPRKKQKDTWINETIIELYSKLWRQGYGHSVEVWQDNMLIGGIYGLAIGGAFFAESMFSLVPNASKVALATLIQKLKEAGYQLFDTQYLNDHLLQFGATEIPRKQYLTQLKKALKTAPKNAFS